MPFPLTPILDTFDRANEDPATGWTAVSNHHAVSGNVLAPSTGAALCLSVFSAGTYGPNCEAYARMPAIPGTNGIGIVGIRLKDTGSIATLDGYVIQYQVAVGTDVITLVRMTNGAGTTLATYNQEVALTDGLGIRATSSTIEAWWFDSAVTGTWIFLGSVEDTTYPAAGSIGLGGVSSSLRFNDFGGGTLKSLPIFHRKNYTWKRRF